MVLCYDHRAAACLPADRVARFIFAMQREERALQLPQRILPHAFYQRIQGPVGFPKHFANGPVGNRSQESRNLPPLIRADVRGPCAVEVFLQ